MMTFGAAWQMGLIPLSHDAISQAIRLNGAAVERNAQAFEMGRWAVVNTAAAHAPPWRRRLWTSRSRWRKRSPIGPGT